MSSSSDPTPTAAFLAESRVAQYLFRGSWRELPVFQGQSILKRTVQTNHIVPLAIATVFVFARRIWGIDDTLITISWFGSVLLTILDCPIVKYGAGRHIQTLTLADIRPNDILAYVVRLVYQLVLTGTKLGICFFCLRVFTDRKSRYIIFGLIGFIITVKIPLLLVQIFPCKPVADAWRFPIQIVRSMNSMQSIIAAIARTKLVVQLSDSHDPSWDDVVVERWCVIEVNTELFCVSIATTKPLMRKAFLNLRSTYGQLLRMPTLDESLALVRMAQEQRPIVATGLWHLNSIVPMTMIASSVQQSQVLGRSRQDSKR
ncbi:hypothetical protein BDZ45DRAFT_802218 [Acephala macrosclerotiorum]|nr:hypothetical protein BDZ45DRAFT_802218 [Acephala macrosclerotiorum]